jgi:hypothetical protein
VNLILAKECVVTEAEWLAATDSAPMAVFLRRATSDRKMRLFACACCRGVWPAFTDPRGRRSVDAAERFADGFIDRPELRATHAKADAAASLEELAWLASHRVARIAAEAAALESWSVHAALDAAGYPMQLWSGDPADQIVREGPCGGDACAEYRRRAADLLRCIFGNPFGPAPDLDSAWLAWQGAIVAQLAQAAYEERRLPEGTLDPARLALVADALEDAGLTDAELLGHLRGPGPHVRGCWALDLVLGKA